MPKNDDKDLHKLQSEVQKLRDQVAAATTSTEEAARARDNALWESQLEAEKVRLQNELTELKDRKSALSRSSAEGPLAAAREAMAHAAEQAKAAEALREADAHAEKEV